MIADIPWPDERVDHIARHAVTLEEIEEVRFGRPLILRRGLSQRRPRSELGMPQEPANPDQQQRGQSVTRALGGGATGQADPATDPAGAGQRAGFTSSLFKPKPDAAAGRCASARTPPRHRSASG